MAVFTKSTTKRYRVEVTSVSAAGSHPVTDKSYVIPLVRSRTGSAMPDWQQRVKDKKNATTPLTAYEQDYSVDTGHTHFNWKSPKGTVGKIIGSGYKGPTTFNIALNASPVSVRNEAKAQAISRLNSKLRQMQTPFEGAIFTGELRETINLLRNPFGSVVKLTDAFYAKQKRAMKVTKASAGQWLEFQMAILPILNDTVAIIDLINEVAQRVDKDTLRVYGESDLQVTDSVNTNEPMGTTGLSGTKETRRTVKVQSIIRCGLTTAFIDGLSYSKDWLKDSFDDLSSIPITLYELTAYSFLIDYFVNIGDMIEGAVSSRSALSYTSHSLVTTTEHKVILSNCVVNRPDLITSLTLFTPTTHVSTLREITRETAVSAIPPMVFTLPGSKIRYANIAALIAARGIK